MRLINSIVAFLAVCFVAVMGFYWLRDGSLESAGREMDKNLAGMDRTTEPLQNSLDDLGEGVKGTVDNATDGDDRT